MRNRVNASGELYYTDSLDAIYDMLNRMSINDGDHYMSAKKVYKPRSGVRVEVETTLEDGVTLFSDTYYIYIGDDDRITMVSKHDKLRKFIDEAAVVDFFRDYWKEHGVSVNASTKLREVKSMRTNRPKRFVRASRRITASASYSGEHRKAQIQTICDDLGYYLDKLRKAAAYASDEAFDLYGMSDDDIREIDIMLDKLERIDTTPLDVLVDELA